MPAQVGQFRGRGSVAVALFDLAEQLLADQWQVGQRVLGGTRRLAVHDGSLHVVGPGVQGRQAPANDGDAPFVVDANVGVLMASVGVRHRRQHQAHRVAVEAGQVWLPEGYQPGPAAAGASRQEEAIRRLALLTRQQARILQLIREGKLNKQIAFELSIAETTVKAHVTAIMRKLGVQSRTQAVLLAGETSFANLVPEGG